MLSSSTLWIVGARYSDRFFGSAAARDAEGAGAGGTSGGAGERRPEDWIESLPTRRNVHRLIATSVVAGVLAGAVTGAYGWELRRDREAAALARSTLDVRVEAAVFSSSSDEEGIAVSVRTFNDGAHPVALEAVTRIDERLVLAGESFHVESIAAGDDGATIVHFGLACAAGPGSGSGEPALRVKVRTVDRDVHFVDVAVTAYGGSFDLFLSERCNALAYAPTFQDVSVDVVGVDQVGADAVTSTISLSYNDVRDDPVLEVLEVASTSAAFVVGWDETLRLEPSTGSGRLITTWSVRDCARALGASEADMTLQVTGRLGWRLAPVPALITISPVPTADLAAELVRLAQRVCG